jgi:hypothetical protein
MNHFRNKYFLTVLLGVLAFTACKKQWDQRDAIVDQQLNVNLLQQIQANSNLSIFAGYIVKIGFDKVLSASKTYTVWAPTNAALATIDPLLPTILQTRFILLPHYRDQYVYTTLTVKI